MSHMAEKRKKIVIVGGGITGLSAAFYAQKHAVENNLPVDITLIEKSETFGGKIQTLHRDGFVIEKGPDSFLARKLPIIELSKDLGLEDELVGTNPKAKKTYILHNGRLHRMPPGLVLGIPTQLTPFIRTGLISIAGKARAALDLVLPRRTDPSDESLGDFLERRLGKEVLDHIAEPLLAGIYAGDTHSLSLKTTFPQFRAIEQKHRSLILGMIASKKNAPDTSDVPEIAKKSIFLTYKTGLKTLVDRLVEKMEHVHLLNNRSVSSIDTLEQGGYRLTLDNDQQIEADAVILALPPSISSRLLPNLSTADKLKEIRYVSVANMIMAFDQKDIPTTLDGSGFVVPRKEGRYITACTWTSSKWVHAAPEGKVLLRCYVGRSGDEEIVNNTDEELQKKVRHDLKELMGITAEPMFYEITRWSNSMPQYPVGHLDQLKRVREDLASTMPGILLTGSGYHGVGIPDCVRQGKEAAQEAYHLLQLSSKN
jgi:oxygen-dependent protoporphyrinogen oxidase